MTNRRRRDVTTEHLKRPVGRLEAFLIYNGAPNTNDDPADYFTYPKGVRLA